MYNYFDDVQHGLIFATKIINDAKEKAAWFNFTPFHRILCQQQYFPLLELKVPFFCFGFSLRQTIHIATEIINPQWM